MGEKVGSIPGAGCQPYGFLTDREAIGVIDDPVALVEIGECEFDNGSLDESRMAFEKGAQLDPSNLDAWHGLLKLFFHSSAALVTLDEARFVTGRLQELSPGDPLTTCMSALFLTGDGGQEWTDGLIAGALVEYFPSSSTFSTTPLCLGYYLSFSSDDDDLRTALALLEEASLLEPKSAAPWRHTGRVYGRQGQCDAAVAAALTSIDLYPSSGQTWRTLADAYFFNCTGQESLAELAMLKAVELQRPRGSDHVTLAEIAEMYGDLQGAEDNFLQAVRLEPEEPSHRERLMLFYLGHGRDEEALRIWPDLAAIVSSPLALQELKRRISEPVYERLAGLVAATGWTYACEKDVVSAWKEIARLSGVVLAMDEDDPYALYLRGRSAWRLSSCCPGAEDDRIDEAISDLNRAVAHAHSCGGAFLSKLYNERGLALMRMSSHLFSAGEVEGAMRIAALARGDFENVIRIAPGRGEALIAAREAVEATLSLGWLEYSTGAYESAKRYFSDVADEGIWPSPPASPKERAEAWRALGLIAYRRGKQMFHQAEASGEEGDYEAAAGELKAAAGHFTKASDIERRAADHYLGTAVQEGTNEVERVLLDALDRYLSQIYASERLDTMMNWGFAEYFLGRALKEKPDPETQEGVAHLDEAIRLFSDVLKVARDNPEMLRFRGSALIARGSYSGGVDDILASVAHGTRFVDNALAKVVSAARELIALSDNPSTTDYDPQARHLFQRLNRETDVCGKRLKKEVFELEDLLAGHGKRCDPTFFSDLLSCLEKYGKEGRRLAKSIKRGCPDR